MCNYWPRPYKRTGMRGQNGAAVVQTHEWFDDNDNYSNHIYVVLHFS